MKITNYYMKDEWTSNSEECENFTRIRRQLHGSFSEYNPEIPSLAFKETYQNCRSPSPWIVLCRNQLEILFRGHNLIEPFLVMAFFLKSTGSTKLHEHLASSIPLSPTLH